MLWLSAILWAAMARNPRNDAAARELGAALTKLRQGYERRHGPVTPERIARQIEFSYGVSMSAEQVRKYHAGLNDPYNVRVQELVALSMFYGVAPAKLGKTAGEIVDRARDLLGRCIGWLVAA